MRLLTQQTTPDETTAASWAGKQRSLSLALVSAVACLHLLSV